MTTHIDLDSTGGLRLTFERRDAGHVEARITTREGIGKALVRALEDHLRVNVGGKSHKISASKPASLPTGPVEVSLGIGGALARVQTEAGRLVAAPIRTLSPLETRFLARNGRPYPAPDTPLPSEPVLTTDLHAHFAGCPSAADLIRIGVAHKVPYPRRLLDLAGVHLEGPDKVTLDTLSERMRDALARNMAIPLDRQVPFADMRRIYRLRSPLTKSLDTFAPLCRQIASDYAQMGCRYAELSFATVVETPRLAILKAVLEDIEADTGVRLRFLAAMGRNDDPEWDLDYIARLEALADCPFIVGVDFIGHENNSTHHIAPFIRAVAKWAHHARPGFLIRVHAGENPAHPENIRVALEAVAGFEVQIRIGHGLYGADERTVALMRSLGAIVEFNLSSNYTLNNIQHCQELPMRRYLDAGVGIVLGTDGYGIYQTTTGGERQAAWLAGLGSEALEMIAQTEARYLAAREASDSAVVEAPGAWVVPPERTFVHFTDEAIEARNTRRMARDGALERHFEQLKVPRLDESALHGWLDGKVCVSFAGAWRKSWPKMPEVWQRRVIEAVEVILRGLDPATSVVITGGTRFGLEAQVHQIAARVGLEVLGVVVGSLAPELIEPEHLTNAWIAGERLYDKAAALYGLMRQHGSWCLFFGGGDIVGDEIQCAENLHLRILLMVGPPGASTEHALMRPHRAFERPEEVLMAMSGKTTWGSDIRRLRHPGPNPAIDAVVTRHNPSDYTREVLLIQRCPASQAEPGRWALPGGFVRTSAARESPWVPGSETLIEAVLREVEDESGLNIDALVADLIHVELREGGGRDPRDTDERWVRAEIFALALPDEVADAPLAAGTDAKAARWVPLDQLPWNLAFDHGDIVRVGMEALDRGE